MSEVKLRKPASIWSKPLSFDFRPIFSGLSKAVAHLATGKVEEIGGDVAEVVSGLGLAETVEEQVFQLVNVSLLKALNKITQESVSHFDFSAPGLGRISSALENSLKGVKIVVDEKFFRHPGDLDVVGGIVAAYQQWLLEVGVSVSASLTISQRLSSYFVFEMAAEWSANSNKYAALLEPSLNPFASAVQAERGWNFYHAYLKKRVSESIFDEPFSLSQIYIPLNAYYSEDLEDKPLIQAGAGTSKVCVGLNEELKSWLVGGNKTDALRVISGGPGSGKSSFMKMFCCEIYELGLAKPIYIPLHLIDPVKDVASEVERFIRDEGLIGFNPLDPEIKERNVLLVFDGLDELASLGKVAAQVARDFVQAVERMIERRNLGNNPLFVVISGRELIVQENETDFRKPKQVLTILPYKLLEGSERFKDSSGLLKRDYRDDWWINYGHLIGEKYTGLPAQLKLREIDEVTAQPLLNYLVALSYRRGSLNFTKSLNLNEVYSDLVAAVHTRAYESARAYRPISHINKKDFVRVLEEVGLAAWHGSDGRSTSVKDITLHCKESGLESLLQSFTEGAEAGVTKLLAAFFFRRNGESVGDEASFVFTHKSFGEYLTACRLVHGIERIVKQRKRRKESADDGEDIVDSLAFWARLTGPAEMTFYLKKFLSREIARLEPKEIEGFFEVLVELVEHCIEKSMPMDRVGNVGYKDAVRYDSNSSASLVVALNSCAVVLDRSIKIKYMSEISFGNFIKRICPQRSGPTSPVVYSSLSYLDFSGQCMDMIDLYGANLEKTTWNNCNAHFANFASCDFLDSDFYGAKLNWSRFSNSGFKNCIFRHADLTEAIFSSARVYDSDFGQSDLRSSSFDGAVLRGCNFVQSDIKKSSFSSAEFEGCDFSGAYVLKSDRKLINLFARLKGAKKVSGDLDVS